MRRIAAALLAILLLASCIAAVAAGGSSSDPLLTQSYITDIYIPETVAQADEEIAAGLGKVYDDALNELKAQAELYQARANALAGEGGGYAASFTEQRIKRGDIITLDTGSSGMLLAGSATISYTSGGVVDMTTAADITSGAAMTAQHRYLAAENTICQLTVTSDTAVLAPQGFYSVAESDATDYNELANALKDMGLFKGGDTAYGDGLMLEKAPTRIEGLIMFLRLLGEEQAALSTTEPCPFVDAPEWCQSYVTYAYAKGYTRGVGADSPELYFAPYVTITAGEYMTFVLRALGYQDSGDNPDFQWDSALLRSLELGCITDGEYKLLVEESFLRAQVAYVSYYALDAKMKSGETLISHLTSAGTLDSAQVNQVRSNVITERIV